MIDIRVGIAEYATRAAFTFKSLATRTILGYSDPLFGTYMVVPGRVKRYRMTEIGFNAKENFIARSSLVDARKVIKGIAEVVHGITPVTNWSVIVCHDSTDVVLDTTGIALSKVLLMFVRRTSAQANVFLTLKCLSRTSASKSVCRIRISRHRGNL
jgi:hypothetical protein